MCISLEKGKKEAQCEAQKIVCYLPCDQVAAGSIDAALAGIDRV